MAHLLQIQKLNYTYPNHNVFFDFSLTAQKAAIFYGPNGCGKTTLLRLAAHLIEPASGSIFLNQTTQYNASVLFESSILMDTQTVHNHIQWLCSWQPQADPLQILEWTGLKNKANDAVANLSLGQKQILALSLTANIKADMLVVDEPFAHLDKTARDRATELLNTVSQNTFVMMASVERPDVQLEAEYYNLGESCTCQSYPL